MSKVSDKDKAKAKARANSIRSQISSLSKRGDGKAGETASELAPLPEKESPREFIHRRMSELGED